MRKIVIAGNWKMHKNLDEVYSFCKAIKEPLMNKKFDRVLPILAPSFAFLSILKDELQDTALQVAAQDVSCHNDGAFTGEVSANMLASLGLNYSIVGHSECRNHHNDSNEVVREKLLKLMDNGIKPILCIGESLAQRDKGETGQVIMEQLEGCLRDVTLYTASDLMIAYEPIWAIGTGRTASGEQAQEVHRLIRKWLADTYKDQLADELCILYGGSVKPSNLAGLLSMPDIDGGLIGGASLEANKYLKMIDIALEHSK